MSQKIKVVRVDTKPTVKGGTMVALYDDKNVRFAGFHNSLLEVQAGDVINAEIEVDGKFNNIKSFEFLERAGGIAAAPAASYQPDARSLDMLRLEMRSQESIAAFTEVMKQSGAHFLKDDARLMEVYQAALNWALLRLKPPAPRPAAAPQAPEVKKEA